MIDISSDMYVLWLITIDDTCDTLTLGLNAPFPTPLYIMTVKVLVLLIPSRIRFVKALVSNGVAASLVVAQEDRPLYLISEINGFFLNCSILDISLTSLSPLVARDSL
jgi:hypothetical protein